ncbi:MAG: 3-hydroxyacyl-CoA dehydrogenase NAD-binding domain-containing protein, partial [Thermoleophilia bacterium]|nr:3-hydroxyacyl-CoA dehydrogenase NAD-binding domain-containing protein [Thermoleophilia bacterium]
MTTSESSGAKARKVRIDRAAVLGAGVMGATIAAHMANAGIRVLLLDVVPKDGGDRNRIAAAGLAALEKAKPAAAYLTSNLALIEVGNLEDDLARLSDCDWVVEVVVE